MLASAEEIAKYKVIVPIQVRFCDSDMMGHINNVSYIAFLETARVWYLKLLRHQIEPAKISIILASIKCDFITPAIIYEPITVRIRVSKIGNKSFDFEYLVLNEETKRIIVRAQSTQVFYDYLEGKSTAIPEEVKTALQKIENGEPIFLNFEHNTK